VRKAEKRGRLSVRERLALAGQRTILRVKRSGYGWPGRAYRSAKRILARGRALARHALKRVRAGTAGGPGPRP
jgi:hypothetical protein